MRRAKLFHQEAHSPLCHVRTRIDFGPDTFGVRSTGSEPDLVPRYDVLGKYAQLAAKGKFTIPVAGTHRFENWREA